MKHRLLQAFIQDKTQTHKCKLSYGISDYDTFKVLNYHYKLHNLLETIRLDNQIIKKEN